MQNVSLLARVLFVGEMFFHVFTEVCVLIGQTEVIAVMIFLLVCYALFCLFWSFVLDG